MPPPASQAPLSIRLPWEQFSARCKKYLAGRVNPDLLLEADRFLLQADRDCGTGPWERVASSRSALRRLQEIRAVSVRKLAAGQINQADMDQVEGDVKVVESILGSYREDAARKAGNDP